MVYTYFFTCHPSPIHIHVAIWPFFSNRRIWKPQPAPWNVRSLRFCLCFFWGFHCIFCSLHRLNAKCMDDSNRIIVRILLFEQNWNLSFVDWKNLITFILRKNFDFQKTISKQKTSTSPWNVGCCLRLRLFGLFCLRCLRCSLHSLNAKFLDVSNRRIVRILLFDQNWNLSFVDRKTYIYIPSICEGIFDS